MSIHTLEANNKSFSDNVVEAALAADKGEACLICNKPAPSTDDDLATAYALNASDDFDMVSYIDDLEYEVYRAELDYDQSDY